VFLAVGLLDRAGAPEVVAEHLRASGVPDPWVLRARSLGALTADVPIFGGLRSLASGADEDRLIVIAVLATDSGEDARAQLTKVEQAAQSAEVLVSHPAVQRAGRSMHLPQLAASGLLFLVLGAGLGPHAVSLVGPGDLPSLGPLVALGLGLAGMLIGLNLDPRVIRQLAPRVYGAALVECTVTFLAASVPLTPLWALVEKDGFIRALGMAALMGAAATVSSGHLAERAYRSGRVDVATGLSLSVLAMLHDLIALVALGLGLALGMGGSTTLGFVAVGQALLVGALCGLLLAFLLRSTPVGSEQLAVLIGCLALVSGAAAFLRLSTLLAGVSAGAVLAWFGGRRTQDVFRLLLRVERPAYLLLLFVIGAYVNPRDVLAGGVAVAFVVLRGAGKIAGGRAAARVGGRALSLPAEPGFALLSQGAVALCLAIELCLMTGGTRGQLLLDATAAAAVLNEILGSALFARAFQKGDAAGPVKLEGGLA
jgi:hypothetical protein